MRIHLLATFILLSGGASHCRAESKEGPPSRLEFCAVPTLAAPPATQPKAYDGIEAALKAVPTGVLPTKGEDWTVAKRDVANSSLEQEVKDHPLKMRIKVAAVSKDGEDYIVSAEQMQTPVYTTAVDVHFGKGSALDVARLTVGDEIVVAGLVHLMLFSEQSPIPELGLVLVESGIVRSR